MIVKRKIKKFFKQNWDSFTWGEQKALKSYLSSLKGHYCQFEISEDEFEKMDNINLWDINPELSALRLIITFVAEKISEWNLAYTLFDKTVVITIILDKAW